MKNTNRNNRGRDIGYSAAAAVAVAGFISVILCIAAVVFDVTSPIICVCGAAVIYSVFVAVILLYSGSLLKKHTHAGGNVPDSILRDSVLNMSFPMLICESSTGKVIWYNKAASILSKDTSLFGASFETLLGIPLEDAVPEEGEGRTAVCGNMFYKAHGRKVSSGDKNFVIVTLENVTELKSAYASAAEKDLAVMYIIADNLEELAEYEKEKYRMASNEISAILTDWAASFNAVLKEYEKDKYLCLMESKKLQENISVRFNILDKIRDLRVGESAIPITVSAGVSTMGTNLSEKDKAARLALEMALQRGGDQVVVKSAESIDFYGGMTRTVQKRTKVRARVFANELLHKMSISSEVIVMGHRFADFDCFGAAIGIARLAMFCGVPVHIATDFNDSGMDVCRSIMEEEEDYKGIFVDKEQALDMMQSDMLLIIVDVNNMSLVESPELAKRCMNTVIIDHHRKTAEFETEPLLSYIEPAASATCELVAEMLEQCLPDGMLSASEANMLLAGINLDTKQFTRNTGVRTFGAALYLRDCGADPSDVQELFKTSLEDFTREARFRSNVVVYRGKFAVALGDGEGDSADRVAAAKAADKLLSVEGVIASFALIKIGSTVHISARSSGQINVQLILESLRGGGHFDSAGAQVEATDVTEALTMLKAAIDSYINNQSKTEQKSVK